MTDNIFENEVISDEDRDQAEYDADADHGYALGIEYNRKAHEVVSGLNDAEKEGFWEAYYS